MADAPEITVPVEPAQPEALPAALGGPPDAASVVGVETGLLEVEMRGLSATMVEVTKVSKEEEVRPLPPVAAADPDSVGQVQLDTLIRIQNGIARQCGLQEASLRQKEMNVGQNVMDSVETTMDKVTTALGGFATSVGTLAETLKDMAANQRTASNVGDDQQKKMVSELGQCREMLVHVRNNTKQATQDLKNVAWQMSELRSGAADQNGEVTAQKGSLLYLVSEDLKTSCQAVMDVLGKTVTAIQDSIEKGVHPEKSHKRKLEIAHEEEKEKLQRSMVFPVIHPYTGDRMYLNQEQKDQFFADLQKMKPEEFGKGGAVGKGTATGSEPSIGGKGGYLFGCRSRLPSAWC